VLIRDQVRINVGAYGPRLSVERLF